MEQEHDSIDGVYVKKIVRHPDERGYFAELMKQGEPGYHSVRQTSYSHTKPGVVKAFHYHDYWESWIIIEGRAQMVLHDMRPDSKTGGVTQVIYGGEDEPVLLAIPPGVAHGYKAVGEKNVGMLYHSEEAYDPSRPEQIRKIPFDSKDIGFDWNSHE